VPRCSTVKVCWKPSAAHSEIKAGENNMLLAVTFHFSHPNLFHNMSNANFIQILRQSDYCSVTVLWYNNVSILFTCLDREPTRVHCCNISHRVMSTCPSQNVYKFYTVFIQRAAYYTEITQNTTRVAINQIHLQVLIITYKICPHMHCAFCTNPQPKRLCILGRYGAIEIVLLLLLLLTDMQNEIKQL